jgi:hypothetical protein
MIGADMIGGIAQLGEIVQLAYVPHDIEACARHWTDTVGAGPFFMLDRLKFPKTLYCGEPVEIMIDAWIGYWGSMQIELIRQHGDAPSIYSDWLRTGRTGMHHIALAVADQTVARTRCAARGLEIVQESITASGMEVLYATDGERDSTMIEFLCPNDLQTRMWAAMRQAHIDWDGRDPLRLATFATFAPPT